MLAVLAFHASVPGLAGGYIGVDVFFVISGFLITGLLVKEGAETGRIQLGEFFARRARRLLPSAATVLILVAIAGLWLLPTLRRSDVSYDVLAAALSVGNWRFINEQTNYFAAGQAPSPVLHYWSLAVEEQFYLIWGPLLCLLFLLVSRRRVAIRLIGAVVAVATVSSFIVCIHWTYTSDSLAYLGTPSRVWQFGLGAGVALLARRTLRVPLAFRWALGWCGAAAICYAIVRFSSSTPYPGYASLVPTFGAAAVILAGTLACSTSGLKLAGNEFGGLLSRRAPRAIGRLSYPWYLWHWPVLVFATAHYGNLSWPVQAACVLASAVPAYLTLVFIERPLRRSTIVTELPRRGLSVGAAAVVLALTAGLLVGSLALRQLGTSAPVDLAGLPPGAVTGTQLLQSASTAIPNGMTVPNPVQARNAFPPDGACEVAPAAVTSPACLFGPANANGRIVLLGDSHAGQWFSSILAIADQHDLQLEELVKQGCPLARLTVQNPQLGRTYTECDTWRTAMLARLAHEPKPKLVVISSLNQYSRNQAEVSAAWMQTLAPLRALGVPIVYLRDTPSPGIDVPVCVSGAGGDWGKCAFPRAAALPADPLAELITGGKTPGVTMVDLNPVLCPGTGADCPAVIQGILLYRDDSHLNNVTAVILTGRIEFDLEQYGLLQKQGH